MREEFQADLIEVSRLLVTMAEAVRAAMRKATTALLTADLKAAETVIERDVEVDEIYRQVESKVADTIARQAPVATDLRTVITALHVSADLERMGDLARHVAKLARLRYPNSAVPAELRSDVLEMGQVAEQLVVKTGSIIASRDLKAAEELETDDDEMDRLHRGLFGKLVDPDWTHGVETAVDITLAGRYYERYGDHAVAVARRVVFLVTGDHAAAHGETSTQTHGA